MQAREARAAYIHVTDPRLASLREFVFECMPLQNQMTMMKCMTIMAAAFDQLGDGLNAEAADTLAGGLVAAEVAAEGGGVAASLKIIRTMCRQVRPMH